MSDSTEIDAQSVLMGDKDQKKIVTLDPPDAFVAPTPADNDQKKFATSDPPDAFLASTPANSLRNMDTSTTG